MSHSTMKRRPIDRSLLASFIEYAANNVVTIHEWQRFAVNHYHDPVMEHARSECVGICVKYPDPRQISQDDRDYLHRLARGLRDEKQQA